MLQILKLLLIIKITVSYHNKGGKNKKGRSPKIQNKNSGKYEQKQEKTYEIMEK